MKTMLGMVLMIISLTAWAQEKSVPQKGEEIKIGFTQPLFIVDGIPTSQFDFNLINPDNIASMEVMKAKEAVMLFGGRARNGAIIVTTKRQSKSLELQDDLLHNTSISSHPPSAFELHAWLTFIC